jgi:hypothetical protein
MAYDIKLVRNVGIHPKKYFFDTNVWLLKVVESDSLSPQQKSYVDFFDNVCKSTLYPKPKIILTAILISEIVNRYLRDVGFRIYCEENKLDMSVKNLYKSIYRKSEQFNIDYTVICSEIKAYHNYCDLQNDLFGADISLKTLLKNPSKGLDFNDSYYYHLALKNNFSIVTHDSDFFVEQVEIITSNNDLYQKGKNSVIPRV